MAYHKLIIFFLAVSLSACKNKSMPCAPETQNDTSEVIKLTIKTAFYGYLPDVSAVKRKYYFGDSIMFTADSEVLSIIPGQIDTLKFKVLSEKQIRLIISADSLTYDQPNYLCLREFKKTDTGYFVHLQSLSGVPFGGGGAISLCISKENDSFKVKKRAGLSIN